MPLRPPAVAGRFYPADPATLAREVEAHLGTATAKPRPRLAVVAPHAGYVYSGKVAGAVFAATEVPRKVVVLAPNHTGLGRGVAVWPSGAFALPGGEVPIDEAITRALLAAPPFVADTEAHQREHALEVELPFLRARRPDLQVAAVIVGGAGLEACLEVGERLAEAIRAAGEPVLVVASSDMSHYLPNAEARRVDARALEPLLALDPEGLYRRVRDEDISMCGVLPVTCALACARRLGAQSAELVAYATSAEAFGDESRVVGYAGVAIA
jgi:hypothetical protein